MYFRETHDISCEPVSVYEYYDNDYMIENYCLNCGKEKEEYESMYCDKCFEEEEKRLKKIESEMI